MYSCLNIHIHFYNCKNCKSYIRKAQYNANLIVHDDSGFTLICEKKQQFQKKIFSKQASDLGLYFLFSKQN